MYARTLGVQYICTCAHWAYSSYVCVHTGHCTQHVGAYLCTRANVCCARTHGVQYICVRARAWRTVHMYVRTLGVQFICMCAHWPLYAACGSVSVHSCKCLLCAHAWCTVHMCARARMAYSTYVCVCARKCLLYVRLSQAIHSKKGVSAETCRRMKAAGASSPVRRITAATSRHGTDPRLCPVVT